MVSEEEVMAITSSYKAINNLLNFILFLCMSFIMVSLMLLGYISIVCNVLLAWATLHQPYISTLKQTLSSPHPK